MAAKATHYPPLETVTRPTVPTPQAAYYLNRSQQTLRIWAMNERPIRPVRIHGRLGWKVVDIRKLLGAAVQQGGAA
ncbi:MAG: DNA-binding protein [Acidovorax sp.]|uniref:DNA-binding protein n=1 Tax=Acidovorax sp. TaxID=1872122 RepID=UPI0039E53DD7